MREGQACGAEVRFIDLPAWHPAFAERADRYANRYADAEARYAEATRRLCAHFAVDSADALWDRLFEVADPGRPGAVAAGAVVLPGRIMLLVAEVIGDLAFQSGLQHPQ